MRASRLDELALIAEVITKDTEEGCYSDEMKEYIEETKKLSE